VPRVAEGDIAAATATPVPAPRTEIRLSGSGGQGIILAATLLADAAMLAGKQVVQTQSYGPEARGGASKAEVIIADDEIDFPEVRRADVTLCLSQAAFDRYDGQARPGGVVVYDEGLVEAGQGAAERELWRAPFTRLAVETLGKAVIANVLALAALAMHTGIIDRSALDAAIAARLPERLVGLNLRAVEVGWTVRLTRG
jgi:2-oxoglutarate ferredoxin oxidoreductase subunit gamma